MRSRSEYVVGDADWDEATRLGATRQVLGVVQSVVTHAETDIPWDRHDRWPEAAVQAAVGLRERYIPAGKHDSDYMQTGVQAVDADAWRLFATFAPYAFDCTMWGPEGVVASLADEGTSMVVSLTDDEGAQLQTAWGASRVVSVNEARDRHPSTMWRLIRRVSNRG